MAEPSIDVEKVVREVLAQLGVAPQSQSAAVREASASGSPAPSSSAGKPQARVPAASNEPDGALAVPGPVVTMAELEGRLEGIRRLVVRPQAVVTPSLRDELQKKNITLVYEQPAPAACAGNGRLVMTVLGSRFDAAPLTRALQNEGIEVDARRADCLIAATDQLAGEVSRPDTVGLVLSRYPAVALCLANRHRGVRAVLGVDAATASADAASVGANLLVVDPESTELFQLKQMVSRFCREGPRQCPEVLRKRLG